MGMGTWVVIGNHSIWHFLIIFKKLVVFTVASTGIYKIIWFSSFMILLFHYKSLDLRRREWNSGTIIPGLSFPGADIMQLAFGGGVSLCQSDLTQGSTFPGLGSLVLSLIHPLFVWAQSSSAPHIKSSLNNSTLRDFSVPLFTLFPNYIPVCTTKRFKWDLITMKPVTFSSFPGVLFHTSTAFFYLRISGGKLFYLV